MRKKVLFIGVTYFDLNKKEEVLHLKKKFEGLNREIKPYILAKGKPIFKKKWNGEFYLFPPSLFWPLAFLVAFWLSLIKKIEVIVAQSPLIEGFLGVILKKLLKKELIVEIHGDWKEGPFLSRKRKLEFIQKKFTPLLAKISFKNADKIRGVAGDLIEEAKKIAPEKKYFLFPTFTDLDVFLNVKNSRFDNFILFVGRAQKIKGVRYLREAFGQIKKDFPNFKLVLVGEGLPGGKLSLEEIKNKMKNCYCLVLPSLSEGFPRVLMEAMALGKPVIGSRVGGIPALIKEGQNGFLFEVGHSHQLAEKLKILLKNRNLAIKMGKKGREFIKRNFSNQKYIENYLKMINSPF